MPETVRLPDALDGAEFRSYSVDEGNAVGECQPLASFSLDERVVVMPSSVGGTLIRQLLSEQLECAAGDPIALVGAPGEAIGYDPNDVECVRLLLLNKCTECGNDYPVNGLVERARCTRCGDVQRLSRSFWREDVLEDVGSARTPGARGGGVTLGGPTVECRGLPPLCRKCFTLLEMDALTSAWRASQAGERAQIVCKGCGEAHAARMPPAWALEIFEDLSFVVGEVTGEPGPDGPKPVIFKCPSCLAALEIAGEKRIVRCKYCSSDVYLPDDLWLHFNPAAKRARFWMLFTAKR
jgi:DNA-directed RNA polymerase subunit RPC12/RpoP